MTQHDKAQDMVARLKWPKYLARKNREAAADLITAQAERIKVLEGRLSGLHEAHSKTVDTANEQFHRANRYGSVLQWIAEHGDGEARQRARAALAQGQKEGAER